MDWPQDMHTDLWVFSAGLERVGENGPNAFTWTSVHSTVVASGYDCGTVDGINDAGLAANLLYLAESEFGDPGDRPRLSVSAWTQFVLDTFATVADAVNYLSAAPFCITAPPSPIGGASGLHLAVSDAAGDSAIFELVGGELTIHHDAAYTVMTNSPVFDQQLAIDTYWRGIGASAMLPGTSRAADRFVRASYYLSSLPRDVDARHAAAGVYAVQQNAAIPPIAPVAGKPELSRTLWTTVADSTDRRYYFRDATNAAALWVDLPAVGFGTASPSRRLNLPANPLLAGDASHLFEENPPFAFLGTSV